MHASRFAELIAAAAPADLERVAKLLWQGHAEGALTDAEANTLAEAIQGRRGARTARPGLRRWERPALAFPRARSQRAPDRQRSIERRRTLAASGPMPPHLAAAFTTGELAVLRIVADEYRAKGVCDRTVAELAARAGVGASTARNAIRSAVQAGLLTVKARPRPGRKNLTNLVRVISREWLLWLARGPLRRPDGWRPSPPFKNTKATDSSFINELRPGPWRGREAGLARQAGRSGAGVKAPMHQCMNGGSQ